MDKNSSRLIDPLQASAEVVEQPFTSQTPIIGGFIVYFRTAWNNVAAKWFVRRIQQQQNAFNHLLVEELREAESQLIELDKRNNALTRQVAQLQMKINAMKREVNSQK